MKYRERIYQTVAPLVPTEADYVAWSRAALHRLRQWLPPDRNAKCLDLGCGLGHGLHMLKSAGYTDITGVDINPASIAVAKRVWSNVEAANAVDYLRRHVGVFDLVIAIDVIEHFTKEELFDVLDVLHDAIKPGGRLIVQVPNAESPWVATIRYGDLTHQLAFDSNSLAHAMSLAGFRRFEVGECGPYVHGWKSLVRTLLWQCMRGMLKIWNLVETGHAGSGVYTRVLVAKAERPADTA